MIIVNVTGFLTDFTNGASGIELKSSPATVRQALDELWQLHVGLRDRVVTEQGQLRQHVNVFLNGENIRRKELLETKLADGGEITILPSVSGGSISLKSQVQSLMSPQQLPISNCRLVNSQQETQA